MKPFSSPFSDCLGPESAQIVSTVGSSGSVILIQRHIGREDWLSEFTNDYNEVRLSRVRNPCDSKTRLRLNQQLSRERLIRLYQEWVLDDNYLCLKRTDQNQDVEYQVHKARKRGNDKDAYRINRQLKTLKDGILKYTNRGERLRHTNAVYVTGTIDPRLVDEDLEYAWQYIGYWFNLFLSNLRKKLTVPTVEIYEEDGKPKVREVRSQPKIRILRSWESHESGWPHFHAVICFDCGPRAQLHWPIFQDSNSRWRIEDKQVLEDSWPYGWIDVLALTPGTVEKNLENVIWYVGKNLSEMDYRLVNSWPIKRLLTQSILWYYGKRSYSISLDLVKMNDGIAAADLKKRSSIIQTDLDGNEILTPIFTWEFVGLVRRRDTELKADDWVKTYSDPPDWWDSCWKPHSSRRSSAWGNEWTSGGS